MTKARIRVTNDEWQMTFPAISCLEQAVRAIILRNSRDLPHPVRNCGEGNGARWIGAGKQSVLRGRGWRDSNTGNKKQSELQQ